MSLLQRIEKLESDVRDQVVSAVLHKYGNSLEFQSYMCLSPDIENRPWDEASDPSSGEHALKAKMLMDEMLVQLEQKKLEANQGTDLQSIMLAKKIEQTHSYLQQTYGENPVRFVNAIRGILAALKMVIEEKTVGIAQSPQDESDSLMESDQPMTSTKQESIQQELSNLIADSLNNEKQVKDIEQLKEQYVIKFQEISNNIAKIEFATNTINQERAINQTEKSQQLSKLKEMKTALEQELTRKGEELLVTKRNAVLYMLGAHMQKVTGVQEAINDELQQWCWEQQRSLCGWPLPPSLDGLQGICEVQGEILWRLYQNVMQMDNIFRPVMKTEADIKQMDSFRTSIINLLAVFLRRAFVITEQPPQVLKKVTKFGAQLRLLVGGKLKMHPPEVTCTVVTEKDINKYKLLTSDINHKIGTLPKYNNVLNNKKTMEYQKETNILEVQFKNLSLIAADRQGGKNREAVTDEKSAVLFSASLNLGKETFQVFAVSAPVCLTVHGNQAPDAEATVFWDNAFAEKERTSLEVPEEVPWPRMAEALSNRWKLWNETGLTQEHLLYLGQKLFPDATAEDLQNRVVTRPLFSKDHLQSRQLTFWQWYYGAMDVVKRNMVNEWKEGHVAGFLGKQQSRDQLLQREPGTFLLRFSDGEVGGVTVPYVTVAKGQIDVWNLRPWTNKDFSKRKLSDRMKDIEEIKFLYPDQKPKHDIFTSDPEEMPPQPNTNPEEYVDTELATRVKGSNPAGMLASPGRTPFAMDQMEPHFAMFAGSPQSSVALDTDLGSEQTIGSPGITNDELSISTAFLNSFQNTGPNMYDDLTTLNVPTSY